MKQTSTPLDGLQRYVRVRSPEMAKFIEFDFAIGTPDLYVELVLPRKAFRQFCEVNQVQHMDAQMCAAVDADMHKWRYGESAEELSG